MEQRDEKQKVHCCHSIKLRKKRAVDFPISDCRQLCFRLSPSGDTSRGSPPRVTAVPCDGRPCGHLPSLGDFFGYGGEHLAKTLPRSVFLRDLPHKGAVRRKLRCKMPPRRSAVLSPPLFASSPKKARVEINTACRALAFFGSSAPHGSTRGPPLHSPSLWSGFPRSSTSGGLTGCSGGTCPPLYPVIRRSPPSVLFLVGSCKGKKKTAPLVAVWGVLPCAFRFAQQRKCAFFSSPLPPSCLRGNPLRIRKSSCGLK